jgi:hypothetical protein
MVQQLQELRQTLRTLKNNLIDNYYQFRLNSSQDPYQIGLRKKPYRILFILSHMRSGSSLLTHILNSNPEIIGYGESHLHYASELDFKPLMFKVYSLLKNLTMNHKYVLDKVLHSHKFEREQFLTSEQVYNIFLLREPRRTLASILDRKPHLNEQEAYDYYVERLLTLEKYAKLINSKERSLFITYDQLVNQTDLVLSALQDFLETKEGFSEQYQVLKTTGMRGVGDSSKNIQVGRIIKNSRKLEIEVSEVLVEKARQAFNQSCQILSEYCQTVVNSH